MGCLPEIAVTEHALRLERGDALLLYTDGAVEQRGMLPAVGELALVRALETATQTAAHDAVDHIRRAVEHQHVSLDDDIALILARVAGP